MILALNFWSVALPTLILFGVALIFGILIVLLGRVLTVEKDAKIEEVRSYLPGSNCGACGKAGCDDFAQGVVKEGLPPTNCTQLKKENSIKINEVLGLSGDGVEEMVCVVKCSGGNNCKDKYDYLGYGDCKNNELLSGGTKMCEYGCMGRISCSKVCNYYAIDVNKDGYSEVDPKKCVACGLCMKECPKGIIERIPKKAKVFVACSSSCKGREITQACTAGCISCGLCVKACPHGAITMVDNLPQIDYNKCLGCNACVEKCPRKTIKKLWD